MAHLKREYNNGFIIYKYDFNSLDDFLNELITKKINQNMFVRPSSIYSDYEFTRTNSFEEAWNLCKFTYDDGYRNFSDLVRHVEFNFANDSRVVNTYKPVGSSASVPRFLYGIPDNMHAKKTVYNKPVINIYYQFSYNSGMTPEQIRNRGILTLALINYLENVKNYNVIFNFFSAVKDSNEIIYTTIRLKDKNEKLKLKNLYFPIVHPSFTRRLFFRMIEIIPKLQNKWFFGYGYALKYGEINQYINLNDSEKSIYISTPEELGIMGYNIDEDANRFIDTINLKYNFLSETNNYTKKLKRQL